MRGRALKSSRERRERQNKQQAERKRESLKERRGIDVHAWCARTDRGFFNWVSARPLIRRGITPHPSRTHTRLHSPRKRRITRARAHARQVDSRHRMFNSRYSGEGPLRENEREIVHEYASAEEGERKGERRGKGERRVESVG